MRRNIYAVVLLSLGFAFATVGCSSKPAPHLGETVAKTGSDDGLSVTQTDSRYLLDNGKLGGSEGTLVHAEAKIESIDYKTREFSIRTNDGEVVKLLAPAEVLNFKQVKAGDKVAVDYLLSVEFEARQPTPEELQLSQGDLIGTARAQLGQKPGVAALEQNVRIVTVASIDRTKDVLVVRNQQGDFTMIKAKYPQNLAYVKTGDTIVVKVVEALAAAVVPMQ